MRAQEDEVEDAVSAAASVLTHLARERLPHRLLCANAATDATDFGNDDAPYWQAMRLLARVRADGHRTLSELTARERGNLGEGVVLVARSRDGELPAAVRGLRDAGLSVIVVALATHTYRMPAGSGGASADRGAEFYRAVVRLENAGAAVRTVEHPVGVAGLSGSRGTVRSGGPA